MGRSEWVKWGEMLCRCSCTTYADSLEMQMQRDPMPVADLIKMPRPMVLGCWSSEWFGSLLVYLAKV